jgi:hypothetical protein
MNLKLTALLVLTVLLALVVGCDPTPYALVVQVTDENDNAISGAVVTLRESKEMQATDEAGEITWVDLEHEVVTLVVAAEGYRSRTVEVTPERRRNKQVVVLEQAVPLFDLTHP